MKYVVLNDLNHTKTLSDGTKLNRILALETFSDVKKGDIGGWLSSEDNLSQDGNCWIYDEAMVYNSAVVKDDAQVFDSAVISDNALIKESAKVHDHAQVYGTATVSGSVSVRNYSKIYGNAKVSGNFSVKGDYSLFDNTIVTKMPRVLSTEDLTMVLTDNNIIVGCSCYPISKWEKISTPQIELITPGAGWLFTRYEELFKSVAYLPYLTAEDILKLQDEATASMVSDK